MGRAVAAFSPDAVVHIAAMTVVSACEKGPELAARVNVQGTYHIARACEQRGVRLVHVSTDMVFDGDKGNPYGEEDEPNPVTVYAQTKLEAEKAVEGLCPEAAILRPALMYGKPAGAKLGFLHWMRVEAGEKGKVPLFVDQYRTPVFVGDVCKAIWQLLDSDISGKLHLGGPERVNRVTMGEMYLPQVGLSTSTITPVRIDDVKPGYRLQRDLSLDSSRARDRLGMDFTSLAQGLRQSV